MTTTITDLKQNFGYYDRTDATKNYDKHLFIAGRILQSAEMNEIQSSAQAQLKAIADALFKDGDIVRDARASIDSTSLQATLESGAVYVRGQVRGVGERIFTITGKGTEVIGIWLVPEVVTDADDKTLLDPASGTQGFNEAGAYRLRLTTSWGIETDLMQSDAEFFPVYYVDDGLLRAKEPPPNLDSVTQSIARYDVDSNGSNYVVNGMRVSMLGIDPTTGEQSFSVAAGRARVNGFGISLNSARRVLFPAQADLMEQINENFSLMPAGDLNNSGDKLSPYPTLQRVNTRQVPVDDVTRVLVVREFKATPTRSQTAAEDALTGFTGSIREIVEVKQGNVTYVRPTDYDVDNQYRIVWKASPTHPAPAAGSQYEVTLRYFDVQQPQHMDETGFYVENGVVGATLTQNQSTVEFDYSFRLPRIDRLVVDETGKFSWILGIATQINPAPPQVPENLLSLCMVNQTWMADPTLTTLENDAVRMVSMSTLEGMNERLDNITDLIAQLNLVSDINVRDAGKKRGLFVDPFTNDSQRDEGFTGDPNAVPPKANEQTLAVTGGALQLAIEATPLELGGVTETMSCVFVEETVLANEAYTSSMSVNPYEAFEPFPSQATITPQIDRWVDTKTVWAGPQTRYFVTTVYAPWTGQYGMHMTQNYTTGQNTVNELAGTSSSDAEYLRQINVAFKLAGFLGGEAVTVTFDGINVTP